MLSWSGLLSSFIICYSILLSRFSTFSLVVLFVKIETERGQDGSDNSDSECNDMQDLSRITEMRLIPSDPTQCVLPIYILVPFSLLTLLQYLLIYLVLQWILCFKYSVSVQSLIPNQMMVSANLPYNIDSMLCVFPLLSCLC